MATKGSPPPIVVAVPCRQTTILHSMGQVSCSYWVTRASPWEAQHPLMRRCLASQNQTLPDHPLLRPSLNKPRRPASFDTPLVPGVPPKPLILQRALGTPYWYSGQALSPGGGCTLWAPLPICWVPAGPSHPWSSWGTGQRGFS